MREVEVRQEQEEGSGDNWSRYAILSLSPQGCLTATSLPSGWCTCSLTTLTQSSMQPCSAAGPGSVSLRVFVCVFVCVCVCVFVCVLLGPVLASLCCRLPLRSSALTPERVLCNCYSQQFPEQCWTELVASLWLSSGDLSCCTSVRCEV